MMYNGMGGGMSRFGGGGYGGYGGGMDGGYGGYGAGGMGGMGAAGGSYPGGPPTEGPNLLTQKLIPQLSLRTFVRFVTEIAAIIQGLALVFATLSSWMQSQQGQGGQPGPLGQLYQIVKSQVGKLFGKAADEGVPADVAPWVAECLVRRARSSPGRFGTSLSWKQWFFAGWLTYSVVTEFRNYRRLSRLPVSAQRAAALALRRRQAREQKGLGKGGKGGRDQQLMLGPGSRPASTALVPAGAMQLGAPHATAGSGYPAVGGDDQFPGTFYGEHGNAGGEQQFRGPGGIVEQVEHQQVEHQSHVRVESRSTLPEAVDYYFRKQTEMKATRRLSED